MKLSSADRAFGIISIHKKLLTREIIRNLESELKTALGAGQQTTLEAIIRGKNLLSDKDLERITKTRARHGRSCDDCGGLTFLLPGQRSQEINCEHCGGELSQGRIDRGSSRKSKRPTAKQPQTPAQPPTPPAPAPSNAPPPRSAPRARPTSRRPPPPGRQNLTATPAPSPPRPKPAPSTDSVPTSDPVPTYPGSEQATIMSSPAPALPEVNDPANATLNFTPEDMNLAAGSDSGPGFSDSAQAAATPTEDLNFRSFADEDDAAKFSERVRQAAQADRGQNDPSQGRPTQYQPGMPVERGLPNKSPATTPTKVSNRANQYHQWVEEDKNQQAFDETPPQPIGQDGQYLPPDYDQAPDYGHNAVPSYESGMDDTPPGFEDTPPGGYGDYDQQPPSYDDYPEPTVPPRPKINKYDLPPETPPVTSEPAPVPNAFSPPDPAVNAYTPPPPPVSPGSRRTSSLPRTDSGPQPGSEPPSLYNDPKPVPIASKADYQDEYIFGRDVQSDLPMRFDIAALLAYPLSASGLTAIGTGAFLTFFSGFVPCVGWGIQIFVFFYIFAFYSRVINVSAKGHTDVPALPDFAEWKSGLVYAVVNFICYLVFVPVIFYVGYTLVSTADLGQAANVGLSASLQNQPVSKVFRLQDFDGSEKTIETSTGQSTVIGIPGFQASHSGNFDLDSDPVYNALYQYASKTTLKVVCIVDDFQAEISGSYDSSVETLYPVERRSSVTSLSMVGPVFIFVNADRQIQLVKSARDFMDSNGAIDGGKFSRFCRRFSIGKVDKPGVFSVFSITGLIGSAFLILIGVAVYLLYFPVAILTSCLLGNWTIVFQFPAIIRTINTIKVDYLGKFFPFAFVLVMLRTFILFASVIWVTVVGGGILANLAYNLFGTALGLYIDIAWLHCLGLLYYHNQKKLGWF